MEKIKNLSIRKTIILYMGISIILSFIVSIFCMRTAEQIQQNIWRKYIDIENHTEETNIEKIDGEEIYDFSRSIERIDSEKMTEKDAVLSEICDFLDTWSILIITMVGCVIGVFLFYRNKIKKPLELLEYGSRMISERQLDFKIDYRNRDEMGRLCTEFENMRKELAENNKKIWHMFEQERMLRAAIAHDIRSPLAVIKGYQEMLKVFIPIEKLDKEKMLEIVESCLKQVDRLDCFVDTMNQVSKVDDREIVIRKISLEQIAAHLGETTAILNKSDRIICEVICEDEGTITVDADIVYEVYENLLLNALRYANKKVLVKVGINQDFLDIYVQDDGIGFQENINEVTKAYYHDNLQEDGIHFGLGLYISSVYCEKHRGMLQLGNATESGAYVNAMFKME